MGLRLSLIFVWETLRIFYEDHLAGLVKGIKEGSLFAYQKKILFLGYGVFFCLLTHESLSPYFTKSIVNAYPNYSFVVAPKISLNTVLFVVLGSFLNIVVLEAVWAQGASSRVKRSLNHLVQAGVLCGVVLFMHVFFLIMIQWLRGYAIIFCYFAMLIVFISFPTNLLLGGSLFVKKEKSDLFFHKRIFGKMKIIHIFQFLNIAGGVMYWFLNDNISAPEIFFLPSVIGLVFWYVVIKTRSLDVIPGVPFSQVDSFVGRLAFIIVPFLIGLVELTPFILMTGPAFKRLGQELADLLHLRVFILKALTQGILFSILGSMYAGTAYYVRAQVMNKKKVLVSP